MNSLYLYISLRHPGRVKIGHSGNCENRRKQLSQELRSVVIGGGMWLIFADKVEKALHGIYKDLNTNHGVLSKIRIRLFDRTWYLFPPMPFHSGKDEWFWIVNFLTMFLSSLALWVNGATGWAVYLPVIVLFFPLPFDLLICYALYWVAQLFILKTVAPIVGTASTLIWLHLKHWFLSLMFG